MHVYLLAVQFFCLLVTAVFAARAVGIRRKFWRAYFDLSKSLHDAKAQNEQLAADYDRTLSLLEQACVDLRRCERKLARSRTSRARYQSHAAGFERLYRAEFRRAHVAEAQLQRAEYKAKYAAGTCGRLLIDGQTTCGRCNRPAHEDGQCRL